MFDLPAMLGEYLLPLLILLPLAVVLVMMARRQQQDEPWQQRPMPPRMQGVKPPPAPASPVTAPELRRAATPVLAPAPSGSVDAHEPTQPMPFLSDGPATPFAAPPAFAAETVPLPLDFDDDHPGGPRAPAGAALPVLIVDDSAVVRAKLSRTLSAAGYSVTAARHGLDALEQLERHWFAVMITDLEMPEMDGFDLIARVAGDARWQLLPVIAITGHEHLQAKVQDARGLYGIFRKPWDDRELLQRVGALAMLRPRA